MQPDPIEPAEPIEAGDAVVAAFLEGDTAALSRTLLRSAAPRLLRDILGPTLSFYVTWKLTGSLVAGVALGTAFSLAAYRYERRHGRPGAVALLVLGFVVVQAAVAVALHSAEVYLIQPAILGCVNGAAWLVSVAIGKPLAALFAGEFFPLDAEVRASDEFRGTFRHLSLLFGVFFLGFALLQLLVLAVAGVDALVAMRVLDAIGVLGLIVYAVRYTVARLGPMVQVAPPAV